MSVVVAQLLQSHALGIRIIQYVASIYALVTLGARNVAGGAETGYELVARCSESVGLESLARWIRVDAVPAVGDAPVKVVGVVFLGAVFLMALALAHRVIDRTYDLTPQPAFGCLLVATLGVDLGVVRLRDLVLMAATIFVMTVLWARYGRRRYSWLEGVGFAAMTVLSPLAASLYIVAAALTWLTGDISSPTTKVQVDALPSPLKVELVPRKQRPGSVPPS